MIWFVEQSTAVPTIELMGIVCDVILFPGSVGILLKVATLLKVVP